VQFAHSGFVDCVLDALALSGAPADCLMLEITEGLPVTDLTGVEDRLPQLALLGVRSKRWAAANFESANYCR
jgi:EAL domain-containing protein (putative c-di-GMP-specific phosphodiesterase class I)